MIDQVLLFAFLNLLAAMSPGPDFAVVVRYGLMGSRRDSLLATFGIAVALLVHSIYCLLGVALFLQSSPLCYCLVQGSGALYLGYLGSSLWREGKESRCRQDDKRFLNRTSDSQRAPQSFKSDRSSAFITGFLTNLANPKAMIFLLSLFAQFVTPETSLSLKLALCATLPLVAFLWFGSLSYILTLPALFSKIKQYQSLFTQVMGALLLVLCCYVLAATAHQVALLT